MVSLICLCHGLMSFFKFKWFLIYFLIQLYRFLVLRNWLMRCKRSKSFCNLYEVALACANIWWSTQYSENVFQTNHTEIPLLKNHWRWNLLLWWSSTKSVKGRGFLNPLWAWLMELFSSGEFKLISFCESQAVRYLGQSIQEWTK